MSWFATFGDFPGLHVLDRSLNGSVFPLPQSNKRLVKGIYQ